MHKCIGRHVGVCSAAQSCPFVTPWAIVHQAPLAHGIFQGRTLEWVAIFLLQGIFSTQGSSQHVLCLLHWLSHFCCAWPSVTPWTIARQAPLFLGFERQGYWSGLPCPLLRQILFFTILDYAKRSVFVFYCFPPKLKYHECVYVHSSQKILNCVIFYPLELPGFI